jgi:hypothetical protein
MEHGMKRRLHDNSRDSRQFSILQFKHLATLELNYHQLRVQALAESARGRPYYKGEGM